VQILIFQPDSASTFLSHLNTFADPEFFDLNITRQSGVWSGWVFLPLGQRRTCKHRAFKFHAHAE